MKKELADSYQKPYSQMYGVIILNYFFSKYL